MSVSQIKAALGELGARPSKRLGQHFLADERVAERHIAAAAISRDETVLEIGPGLGALTGRLLERARRVVAIESDRVMCGHLERRFAGIENLKLISGDALKVDLPQFDVCVSNLPYQISSPATFRLLGCEFDRALLMYQLEFAARMVAKPGTDDYSRLSVMAQHRAACAIEFKVPRSAFWPQPKVESAVVSVVPREPEYNVVDERLFETVVRVLFSHRRKKIRTALVDNAPTLGLGKSRILARLEETPYADERVERLSPAEIAEMVNALAN
jgi:16S rRNA (adenine1518-N6/adenine1519-N6)-dimethyltransferase